MRKTKENAGITLIALVITIIVLLILAGISIITLTGQNGILTQANKAKQENELGEEKEKAGLVSQELKIEKAQGKEVDKTGFQKMVDSQFGASKATGDVEDSTYVIVVAKTGNIYLINEDGTIDEAGNKKDMKKDENPGVLEDLGNNTYAVNSIEDLVALSYAVNSATDTYEGKTVTLGRSLYFNGMFDSYANPDSKYEVKTNEDSAEIGYAPNENATTTIKELVTTGEGFMPIGANSNGFKGNFDGKNNYIDGLYIKRNSITAGLFFRTEGEVTISNVGIKSGTIEVKGYASAIVGLNLGKLTIENCYNKANVNTTDNASGIIAVSIGNGMIIENCYNEGKISGKLTVGGIVGRAGADDEIRDCHNSGELKGLCIGGIVGMYGSTVSNCYNSGTIISLYTGKEYYSETGGIAGQDAKKIENCYNKGKIIGGLRMAGILSYIGSDVEITNCYNEGELELKDSTTMVGGILGNSTGSKTSIEKCYNTASISGNSFEFVGGIAGIMSGSIIDCYNTGSISGNTLKRAGGIAGIASRVTRSHNTGNIQGKTGSACGIACYGEVETVDCYNTGNMTGNYSVSGIVAGGNTTNCYNTGNITSTGENDYTSGITRNGNATNCYNTGNITGGTGGNALTAGVSSMGNATNCYNTGNIIGGAAPTAGISAYGDANNCYNTGDVSGKAMTAGVSGMANNLVVNCYNTGKIIGEGSRSQNGRNCMLWNYSKLLQLK